MFSRFIKTDLETKDNEQNDVGQLNDATNLLINTQFMDNSDDITCRYFNQRNHNNAISPISSTNGPIFIQQQTSDAINNNDSNNITNNSHEHLMLLAAATAAVASSSPSNDSCKSSGNNNNNNYQADNLLTSGESPHFSIHDPPLIRLSPTSPNNLFRNERFNDEFTGLTNSLSNAPFSPTNVDWLGQELYVKAENNSSDLAHSNLKQHSFTNSLSDNDLPTMIRRGRTNYPIAADMRDSENLQNSSTHFRSRKDLKRKRPSNPDIDFSHIVNNSRNISNSGNLNSDNFIDLTEPDPDSLTNNINQINERLTPELSNRHYQWWPFKKHCSNPNTNLQADLENSVETLSLPTPELNSTSSGGTSPAIEDIQILPQYDSYSSFYAWPSNSADPCINGHHQTNIDNLDDHLDTDLRTQTSTDQTIITSTFVSPIIDTTFTEPRNSRPDVSSYLRRVFVPQFRHRGRYLTPNIPTSSRDINQYLRNEITRSNTHQASNNNFGLTDSAAYFPPVRRTSSGSYIQSAVYESNRNLPDTNQSQQQHLQQQQQSQQPNSFRSFSYVNRNENSSRNNDLLSLESFPRTHSVGSTLNSFLRACGLEEVRQRRRAEENAASGQHDIHSILNSNPQQMHPLMRWSERNFLNVMLDHRSPSQFTHPFTMYESQGNMESVIQLALHLETSWRGINPSELAQLPCHYYKNDLNASNTDLEKQDKCMVCLEEFLENDHLRTLSCSHQYHVICVDKWLKMNRTCPMCRADATLGSSSYIFVN